ncbi:MAG: hypothetical protein H7319_21415 [Spirosoma sp.]|nr:hypothetical protein [Spirosoma sp.]
MNLDYNPTLDQLCQLIASVDDDQDSHILFVTKSGDVHLSPFRADTATGADYANEDTLQFVLDTFMIAEGYTGREATQDLEWMDELFSALNEHWAEKTTGFAWKSG